MIVRPRPRLWELFFIWKGSIIPQILPQVLFATALATAVTLVAELAGPAFPDFATGPFTFLGLSLSLFLGFRNNACYDRWWEARKLYGGLLIVMRNLARETQILDGQSPGPSPRRKRVLELAIAFTQTLTAKLRDRPINEVASACLNAPDLARACQSHNIPDGILGLITAELLAARRDGTLDSVTYSGLAAQVNLMAHAQGCCERLRATPLPFAYTLLLHRTAHLFCGLIPFGMVHGLGFATPLMTAIVAYTFFGLDALGDQLEEPFGLEQNDLPLDAMTRSIEIDLAAAAGHHPLPEPLQPRDYLLL
ncbi:bestrophin family protein [Zoogloea sp.]|uniref:bestrophin family protein n=1 Tax=Zoogloea sp. TaxID=49181 RepID=UPI0035B1A5FE|nr:bestrophin [Rhodocyclales bacterium]